MQNPDFLIVGGGTAGSVLASRLSEDGVTRVLLIEAGQDTPPDATPADIADTFPSSSLNRAYFWPDLKAERVIGEARRSYPQARVMGGGSSVMGMWALRGIPADFNSWSSFGAQGWAWDDVVKFYRQIEDDDVRQRESNEPAPMPIRRVPKEQWPGFARAFETASAQRGFSQVDDINENGGDGFFSMPLSQGEGRRASSPQCYLTDAVRRRANLQIMANARVTRLNVKDGRVESVAVEQGNETKTIVRAAGDPERRRHSFAGDAVAQRHRPGAGFAKARHRAGCRPARRRRQFAKPSLSAFRRHHSARHALRARSASVCRCGFAPFVRT